MRTHFWDIILYKVPWMRIFINKTFACIKVVLQIFFLSVSNPCIKCYHLWSCFSVIHSVTQSLVWKTLIFFDRKTHIYILNIGLQRKCVNKKYLSEGLATFFYLKCRLLNEFSSCVLLLLVFSSVCSYFRLFIVSWLSICLFPCLSIT